MVEQTRGVTTGVDTETVEATAKTNKREDKPKGEYFTNQGVDIIKLSELADIMIAKYASHEKQTETTKLQGYLRAVCDDVNILNDMYVGTEGVKTQYFSAGDVYKREEYLLAFKGTMFQNFIIPGVVSLDGTLEEWTVNLRRLDNRSKKLNKTPSGMGADIAKIYSFFRKMKGAGADEPLIDIIALHDANLADKSICRTTGSLPIILKDLGPTRFESADRRDFETTKFVMRRLLLEAMAQFGN